MSYLVLRALGYLLKTELLLISKKDQSLQEALRSFPVSRQQSIYTPEQICSAFEVACVGYFKVVLCLQRSVAVAMFLRRCGFPAELVVGAQIMPPKFHAWVLVNEVVVTDKAYVPSLYRELSRC